MVGLGWYCSLYAYVLHIALCRYPQESNLVKWIHFLTQNNQGGFSVVLQSIWLCFTPRAMQIPPRIELG